MKKTLFTFAATALALCMAVSCTDKNNTLTSKEKADGWQLLFDGQTLDGWRDYNGTSLTGPWEVVDGTIQADGGGSDANGYIVTEREFSLCDRSRVPAHR